MRKVDVVRPPINYAVLSEMGQIAWFVDPDDAQDFVNSQPLPERYEIVEARR